MSETMNKSPRMDLQVFDFNEEENEIAESHLANHGKAGFPLNPNSALQTNNYSMGIGIVRARMPILRCRLEIV